MVDKHFFKPLLPRFHSHLTIPVAFFSKRIEGRNEQRTAKLRSDASKKTWEVKIEDGQKLTSGWKEFASAHDLRIGDIVIFRQEEDMAFHVTLLGPSFCEIRYESCLEDESNLGKIRKKNNARNETESASIDLSSFVSSVAPSTLRYDRLCLPMSFTRENGLGTRCEEIVLMNEKGKSWTLILKRKRSSRVMYITQGWRSFCCANGLEAGDSFTFKLIQGGRTLVLRLSTTGSKEEEEEESSENDEVECLSTEPESDEESNLERINPRKETKSSSLDPSCFVAYVSPATLRHDKLNLPRSFVRENGINTRSGEILLMNENDKSWTLALKQEKIGTTYIRRGWRSFCNANGLKTGGLYTFILIQRGRTPILRLSSTESESESEEESSKGDEIESLSTEPESDVETNLEKIQRKKNQKGDAESFSLDPSCYVAYVTPSGLRDDRMILRRSFVMENDLEERCGVIVLMNEKGRSWTLNLNRKNACGTMSITGGLRSFCRTNGLKAGSFFTFKLSQTGGALVLRLSSQFQNQFLTLTLKPCYLKRYIMLLPVRFTKMHGINEETKMTMLDKNGVKWSTDLRSNNRGNRFRLVGGWQEFFKANCVKTGESIIVKLIWEGDTSCVLKFFSKVKRETR